MADDKKSPDEYQYPSDEYYKGGEYIPPDDSAEPSETAEAARAPFYLPKRALIVAGVLFAIGIVYLILMYANSRKAADLNQPVETATANIPPASAAPQQQLVAAPAPQVAAPNPSDEAAIQRVAQQNQANQQSMADLQNQVQQLQSQLNDVTNSISTLNSQIQVIVNEIRGIAIGRSVRGRSLGLTTGGMAYQLRALVPGRAWLQARDGSTTSVTVGDRLPGYGIIQMISTEQGVVTTSSGAVIQYGSRDS